MTGSEFGQSPNEQATMLGEDLTQWHARMDSLIAQGAHIVTIRGAGTVNGIEPHAAGHATTMLHDYVANLTAEGRPVALVFDGDEDNRERPDVGSVFGGLVDSLRDNPNVTAICAQKKSWYYPETEGGALASASGAPYETYVFDDSVPGSHAALTQSEALVNYPAYEQVFVGPAGKIAYDQLGDLSRKVSGEPVKVTVLKAPLNPDPAIDAKLRSQLENAGDDAKRATVQDKLTQRERLPYGALFTESGDLADEVANIPGIRLATLAAQSIEGSELQETQANPRSLEKKMDHVLQMGTPDDLETMLAGGEVDVDQGDFQGRTALMLYTAAGNMAGVDMVVARGANVNKVYMFQDRIPMTALDAAIQTGNHAIADKLRSLGAKTGKELP